MILVRDGSDGSGSGGRDQAVVTPEAVGICCVCVWTGTGANLDSHRLYAEHQP